VPVKQLETPVVLIVYNRPDETRRVFEAIAAARPRRLLIVADGPRSKADERSCAQVRAAVEEVSWDCCVDRDYSDINMGVRLRPPTGLDWAFSLVDEAIILEDDCLPAPSFFEFCTLLLDRYRFDERVMQIAGANFQRGQRRSQHGYYFSRYYHVWGWATWKRAWRHYDLDVRHWPQLKRQGLLDSIPMSRSARAEWRRIFDRAARGDLNTWDYQWQLAMWSQYGLAVVPDANLISNIGFGSKATHTLNRTWHAEMPVGEVVLNGTPDMVIPDRDADDYEYAVRHRHQTHLWRRLMMGASKRARRLRHNQ
jgi:hypothetical protein